LHFRQEQIRLWVALVQIGGFEETRPRLVISAACIPSRGKTENHPLRTGVETAPFREHGNCGLVSTMCEQLGSPIEQVCFARIHFGGELIFVSGIQGLAASFIGVRQKMVNDCSIIPSWQHRQGDCARTFRLAGIQCRGCKSELRIKTVRRAIGGFFEAFEGRTGHTNPQAACRVGERRRCLRKRFRRTHHGIGAMATLISTLSNTGDAKCRFVEKRWRR
jgi:hypothetical protein